MNMLLKSTFLKNSIFLFLLAWGFLVSTQVAHAATLTLTVNPAVITNGQSVTLSWYVDGTVSACSINNGIGAIDISSLPASGSITLVPPDNSSTDYILNCDGQIDSVTVATEPVVTLTFRGGSTVTADLNGEVTYVEVEWASQFATKCGSTAEPRMWLENQSTPGVRQYAQGWMHDGLGETTGVVNFDLTRYGVEVRETSTFYFECENETTGVVGRGSAVLTVLDPAPPLPPTINISTTRPNVTVDPDTGVAVTDVSFQAANVSWCTYKAYYADGTEYPNPFGWGQPWGGSSVTEYDFDLILIAATTDFEVTCGRPAITIGGILYPAASVSERVLVNVSGSLASRLGLPPVTVSIVANPNPATKDPITGRAISIVTINPRNADYCLAYAYYQNGDEYNLDGWSRDYPVVPWGYYLGDEDESMTIRLATTTRLQVECRRQADYLSGDSALYDLGVETFDLLVEVTDSGVAAAAPVVRVYGNVFDATADIMWDTAVSKTFNRTGNDNNIYGSSNNTVRNITFPFTHPQGAGSTGVYDIYLRATDVDVDESTFTLSTVKDGLISTHVTNLSDGVTPYWWYGAAYKTVRIASGITLTDGELVTLSCQTTSSEEACRTTNLFFGEGNGGLVAIKRDAATGFGTVPLMWMTENVTDCLPPHQAQTSDGLNYNWSFSDNTYGLVTRQISTTTEFSVRCQQGNGTIDEGMVTASLPSVDVLVASAIVSTGECIDDGTLGNPFGTTIDAPPGYMAGVNGYCAPAVDLAAVSPAVSLASAVEDNINGTYDNINALIVISNLGPGELLANNSISYRANITFQPVFGLPALDSLVGTYNGALATPPNASNPTQSSTLTREFDGVPFGTHTVCSRVNLDGSPNYPEASTDYTNNTSCGTVTLPVPEPPMSITADREVVRSGQTVNINWSVNVTYELLCTVRGAGGLNTSFNTLSFANPHTGSFTTGALTSSSEYVLQCTEPITNTTFTKSVLVEVVPNYEEI